MKSAHDYIMETSFPYSEMPDIENAFNDGKENGIIERDVEYQPLIEACRTLLNKGSGADQTPLIKAISELKPLMQVKTKFVNWFYSDYHQNGHYQGANGGPNNDGIFETKEDAKQYVIDNKVSNCTGQKEIS